MLYIKIILLAAILSVSTVGRAQRPATYTIEGTISIESNPIEAVLIYVPLSNNRIPDTAKVKDGKYRYTGVGETPLRVNLAASVGGRMYSAPLLVGPETLYIEHVNTFDNIEVTGSRTYSVYKELKDKEKTYDLPRSTSRSPEETMANLKKMQEEVYGQYFKKDPHDPLALYALRMYGGEYSIDGPKIAPYFAQLKDEDQQSAAGQQLKIEIDWSILLTSDDREDLARYVENNPGSPIALGVLEQYVGYQVDAERARGLFSLLPDSVRNSEQGIKFAELIGAASATTIGKPAPDFSQNDSTGRAVTLSSFRGKYLLIDFWASWCVPCRRENPNLVNAYRQFKDRGFEILGVALERANDRSVWVKAIADDGLTWPQVSDFKFWNNEVAVLYGIRAVPQNFLIDPNGVIIARNLHGEALLDTLNELLAQSPATGKAARSDAPVMPYTLKGTLKDLDEAVEWVFIHHTDGRPLINYAEQVGDQYYLSAHGMRRQLGTRTRSYFDRDDVGLTDSARVINGEYTIRGFVSQTVEAVITGKNNSGYIRNSGRILLEPTDFSVTHEGSFDNMQIQGSPANALAEEMKAYIEPHQSDPEELQQAYRRFFVEHAHSPIGLHVLRQITGGDYGVTVGLANLADSLFGMLPHDVQQSPLGQKYQLHVDVSRLYERLRPYANEGETLNSTYYELLNAGKTDSAAIIDKKMKAISKKINESIYLPYVDEAPNSPGALYALQEVVKSHEYPGEGYLKVADYFERLPLETQLSVDGRKMKDGILMAIETSEGNIAPDFTQNDPDGNPVTLSSFRGDYVFLDFWASWCVPCRKENPNVRAAWERYKDRGLKIISVSLDNERQRDQWLQAIEDDGMPWIHVSDLKGFKSETVVSYGVNAIPASFLIDPTGKIVAKNLRGTDLQDKLAEVYDEKSNQ